MAKGEIVRLEQFLLLPQCFQKSSAADASTSEKGLIKQCYAKPHCKAFVTSVDPDQPVHL